MFPHILEMLYLSCWVVEMGLVFLLFTKMALGWVRFNLYAACGASSDMICQIIFSVQQIIASPKHNNNYPIKMLSLFWIFSTANHCSPKNNNNYPINSTFFYLAQFKHYTFYFEYLYYRTHREIYYCKKLCQSNLN